MASYVRACAESAGKVKNCSVGLMERKEKAFLFCIGLLLEPILNPYGLKANSLDPFVSLNSDGILILQFFTILVGLLSHITVYQRLRYTRKHGNKTS
jgi:phosphatidylglycerophosphate synthase